MGTTMKCRWCRKGHKPAQDGYHYIVKSVVRARINIIVCADYVPPVSDKPVVPAGLLPVEPTP